MSLYRCPNCGDSSVVATTCDRCQRRMVAENPGAVQRQLHKPATQFPWYRASSSTGAVLGAAGGALVAIAEALPYVRLLIWGGALLGMGAGAAFGATARSLARRRGVALERARLLATRAVASRVADAPEGPVEIYGVVRIRAAVVSALEGVSCAAFLAHLPITSPLHRSDARAAEDPDRFETVSAVGELEINDGSGVIAVVTAGPCELLGALTTSPGERLVRAGDRVRVRGLARWRLHPGAASDYRHAARYLELTGDADTPLVLAPERGT